MNPKEILVIVAVGFILQGMFYAIFKPNQFINWKTVNTNPNKARKVQLNIFVGNLVYWGIIILLVHRFLK